MIKNGFYILIIFASIILESCIQKIINLDLNQSNPQIVVQAEIDDYSPENTFVKLSKSVNFSDSNVYPKISRAQVIIKDDAGNQYVLEENKDTLGLYQNKTLKGLAGRTYTLNILAEGKSISSVCKMAAPVNLTNVLFYADARNGREKRDSTEPDTTYTPALSFATEKTLQNLFLIRLRINKVYDSAVFIRKSVAGIPNISMQPLFNNKIKIKRADTVEVFFSALSVSAYEYLYVLLGQGARNNSTTPSNPTSNIIGEGIGYFSAHPTTYTYKIAPK